MTDEAVNPVLLGAKMGLFAGWLCLTYLLPLHYAGGELVGPWALVALVFIILSKIADAYLLWKKKNNIVSFREALGSLFVVSVVSMLILTVFYYLMANLVDPSILDPVKKMIADNATRAFDENRVSKEQLDEALNRIKHLKFSAGIASVLYSTLLFTSFFYSLVFAAIARLISKDVAAQVSGTNFSRN